jgi:hypothetical protein
VRRGAHIRRVNVTFRLNFYTSSCDEMSQILEHLRIITFSNYHFLTIRENSAFLLASLHSILSEPRQLHNNTGSVLPGSASVDTTHGAISLGLGSFVTMRSVFFLFGSGKVWVVLSASAVMAFFLFGVDELAMQLEEPFAQQVFCGFWRVYGRWLVG